MAILGIRNTSPDHMRRPLVCKVAEVGEYFLDENMETCANSWIAAFRATMPGQGLLSTPESSSAPQGAFAVFAPFASDSSKLGRSLWAQKKPQADAWGFLGLEVRSGFEPL